MTKIPFFGLKRQYANLREELLDVSDRVYSSGQVLDGTNVSMFETAMAGRCHRQFAVAVNSCTQGIIMTQSALEISGQPVIIPTVSFVATLNSVTLANNIPVYCDVDQHGIIDLDSMPYNPKAEGINALMYVNLFGNIVDYDRLRVVTELFSNGKLTVIEDAAQSFGGYYKGIPSGKLGDVSVLSFDPTKNLPNYGSGGMVLTDDWEIYNSLRNLRDNGKESGHVSAGTNSKMSESDCAQMLVKLKYFDEWQRRRKEIADFYTDNLKNYVRVTRVNVDVEHAWHKFPIWLDEAHMDDEFVYSHLERGRIQSQLESLGIETKVHYSTPLPDMACNPHTNFLTNFLYSPDLYSGAELHCKTEISLPIYPELTDLEVEYIVENVIDCISS